LKVTLDTVKNIKPDIRITVMCNHPLQVAESVNLKTVKWFNLKHPFASVKAVIDAEIIIFGPGGILEDATGISILKGNIPNIFFVALLGFILRKKIIFYAVGAGPIATAYGRFLAKAALKFSHLITVRDEGSRSYLLSLGLKKVIHEVSDPAILLEPLPPVAPAFASGRRIKIGVSLRPWFSGSRSASAATIQEFSRCLDYLAQRYSSDVYLLSFDYADDYPIMQEVTGALRYPENVTIMDKFKRVEDALAAVNRMDLLIGMRLHSLIFSVLLAKPLLALEYDPKVKYFMASIGQIDNLIQVDNIRLDEFQQKIDNLIADIANNAISVSQARERLKRKARSGQELLKNCLNCRRMLLLR
jgi:polysaccharide pyruvyl transferase CsaB